MNYLSDNMVDQLSMNFGKKNRHKPDSNFQEVNSVSSVITKGGTVVNPFSSKKKFINRKSTGKSKKSQSPLGERNVSKTNVQFDVSDAENDENVKTSFQKAKMSMIKVYLQTPYKVQSIDEINK